AVLNKRGEAREARIGKKKTGAGLAEHENRHEHGRLAARHNHPRIRRYCHGEPLVQIGRHRLADRRDSGCRRIAVVAVAQRLHGRFYDVIRRAKIRLANPQIDDVAALGGQVRGARQHSESVLLADSIERRDGAKHGPSSWKIDTRPDGRSQNPIPRKFRAYRSRTALYLSPLAKRAFAPVDQLWRGRNEHVLSRSFRVRSASASSDLGASTELVQRPS